MTAAVILSMALTPLLVMSLQWIAAPATSSRWTASTRADGLTAAC